MVQPNAPRFLREGDSIDFSVKVANMSAQTINGQATLQLFDPSTGKEVTGLISKIKQSVQISVLPCWPVGSVIIQHKNS